MSLSAVSAFQQKVDRSPELQAQLEQLVSPLAVINLARQEGIELTMADFQQIAHSAYQEWLAALPASTRDFFEQAQQTAAINSQLKQCQTPAAAIELARSYGCNLTAAELQQAAAVAATIRGFSFEKLWFRRLGLLAR